jgi:hypothetical protein
VGVVAVVFFAVVVVRAGILPAANEQIFGSGSVFSGLIHVIQQPIVNATPTPTPSPQVTSTPTVAPGGGGATPVPDVAGPSIVIASPANGSGFRSTSVNYSIAVTDPTGVASCTESTDGGSNASLTQSGVFWLKTRTGLSDGYHTVIFYCVDDLGYYASNASTYLVDTTPPSVLNTPAPLSVSSGPTYGTVSFYASEASNMSIFSVSPGPSFTTVSHTDFLTYHPPDSDHNITGLTILTTYYFNVTVCDALANCNNTGPYSFNTTSNPPTVTLNSPANGASVFVGSQSFSYTPTDDGAYANASLYGNFSPFTFQAANSSAVVNAASNSITKTTTPGYYVWNVLVCDAGNLCSFASSNRTLTVQASIGATFVILNGSEAYARVGEALGRGEADNAPHADIYAGAQYGDVPGPLYDAGYIVLYNGTTLAYQRQYNGTLSYGSYGFSVAAGDVNGDGFDDVIGGAPNADVSPLSDNGYALVYNGATGAILYYLNGSADGDEFGYAVALADLDGNGRDDIIVGARYADGGGFDRGSVYVFNGSNGNLLYIYNGSTNYDYFGWSVAAADVNGDGLPDVIAGTPYGDGGFTDSGYIRAYSGTGAILQWVNGSGSYLYLGFSVAGGDVNGDGKADLYGGAPYASVGGFSSNGYVAVYSGATGARLYQINGTSSSSYFGYSIGAPNATTDVKADILGGAPYTSTGGYAYNGAVKLYDGSTGGLLLWQNGSESYGYYGWGVSYGDVNLDGYDDIIAAAPQAGGSDTGSVFIIGGGWSSPLPPAVTLLAPDSGVSYAVGTTVTFNYTPVVNATPIKNATLYSNSSPFQAVASNTTPVINNSVNSLSFAPAVGYAVWNVGVCLTDNTCYFAPSNNTYTITPPPTYTVSPATYGISPITAGQATHILYYNAITGAVSMPFTFNYFGTGYSSLYICSNGWISFASTTCSGPPGGAIPSASAPNGIIAAYWDQYWPNNQPIIHSGYTGTAPNRVFLVNYSEVQLYPTYYLVTFQIKLFETSNDIEIHCQSCPNDAYYSNVQGIENQSGTEALFVTGRNYAHFGLTNDAVKFDPVFSDVPLQPSVLNGPPSGTTFQLGTPVTFNYTPIGNASLKNSTLFANFSPFQANQSNTTPLANNSPNYFTATPPAGHFAWNVQVCLTDNNCYFAPSNNTLTILASAAPSVTLNSPCDFCSVLTGYVSFDYTPADDFNSYAKTTLFGDWSGAYVANESNSSPVANGTNNFFTPYLLPGTYLWNVEACDTGNLCAFAPSNFTLFVETDEPPTVTLFGPPDGGSAVTGTIGFTYCPSDDVGFSNASLWGNWSGTFAYDQANASPVFCASSFYRSLSPGYYEWNVQACDTAGQCSFAPSNFTLTVTIDGPPWVTLSSPSDGGSASEGAIGYSFYPYDDVGFSNATLWGNFTGTFASTGTTTFSVFNGSLTTLVYSPTSGYYVWNVLVCDNNATLSSCRFAPTNFTLTVTAPLYSTSLVSYGFSPITAGETAHALGDDSNSALVSLPFTFKYFGADVTSFYICSNGYITFGSYSCSYSTYSLPSTTWPDNFIAAYWEDLNPGFAPIIHSGYTGTAPNRIFLVNFSAVPHYGGGNLVTFQMKLFETSNDIEIHCSSCPSDGGAHVQGIENSTGNQAFFYTGRNYASFSLVSDAVRFDPSFS